MSIKGIIGFIFLFSELLLVIIGLVGIALTGNRKGKTIQNSKFTKIERRCGMNNDLISREALKNEFRAIYHCADTVEELANTMEDAIDNAPTVETSKIEYKAYNEGFKDGVEQGIRLSDRPQGKWIFSRCDKCGAYHNGNRNFCPNCGARNIERSEKE